MLWLQLFNVSHMWGRFKLELAQFPVTALGGLQTKVPGCNHCLNQASSRGSGSNLTRFGNPGTELIYTTCSGTF